ncbi:hypothetical protein F0Q45_00635 [Mycobacterium simiae]|uniref:DUF4157 domain-containing protein n=1 Tax=Mycobacterium simiae TaxID=1784 RepID=A0A5B1BTQ6_MYCSI|nr:hypothetical protein [Mycobacterium simiae]KAA1252248.1 hypothetical protein F0Q45_00635 [Mycobacterium simiae]
MPRQRLEPDRPAQRSPAPTAGGRVSSLVVGDRTVRLVSLGGAGADLVVARAAANIGAAVDAVVAFWGTDWPHEILVTAAGSDEQFRAAAGSGLPSQWADIAAVTIAERVDPAHRDAVGQRIVFAPGAVQMSPSALRIVLTHELFHYAARADTTLDAPRWLTEGMADFVARPSAVLPAAAVAVALPSDSELDTPGPQRSVAYDRAWWFARFVADTYGPAKLREFYLATCGVGHLDLPTAIRDVLGIDSAGLLARWQQWLTR